MFWKSKKVTLVVSMHNIQIYAHDSSAPVTFTYPITVIKNLELIDQIGFEKALMQFFVQHNVSHAQCTIVLDNSYLFTKKVPGGEEDASFFDLIPLPLDQQGQKKVQLDADSLLIGYNLSIVHSIERVLHAKSNIIVSIYPQYAFPAFESATIDIVALDERTARRSSKFDADIIRFKKQSLPHSVTVSILVLSLILVGSLGYGLYYSLIHPIKSQQKPLKKIVHTTPKPSPTVSFLSPKDIKIEIQNGSGRVGEAGKLKTQLETQDYVVVLVGNADKDSANTIIASKPNVPPSFVSGLDTILSKQYVVSSQSASITSSTASADIIITIGIEKK